ncbi:hypothetical protein D018_4809B, partial [Vibrio parahaemolyticus VP2007-007]
ITQRVAN